MFSLLSGVDECELADLRNLSGKDGAGEESPAAKKREQCEVRAVVQSSHWEDTLLRFGRGASARAGLQ